jgi:hypothetical protein
VQILKLLGVNYPIISYNFQGFSLADPVPVPTGCHPGVRSFNSKGPCLPKSCCCRRAPELSDSEACSVTNIGHHPLAGHRRTGVSMD